MTTTALALRQSLALQSGIGTLSIIHHLHLVYIENKEKQHFIHHYTDDLQFHWSEGKNQVVLNNNSVVVKSYKEKGSSFMSVHQLP